MRIPKLSKGRVLRLVIWTQQQGLMARPSERMWIKLHPGVSNQFKYWKTSMAKERTFCWNYEVYIWNERKSQSFIDEWINEWIDAVNGRLAFWWIMYTMHLKDLPDSINSHWIVIEMTYMFACILILIENT